MGPKLWLYGLIPLTIVLLFVVGVSKFDLDGAAQNSPPSSEDLTVERVQITDHGFVVKIRADSPKPMLIAQVMVDGAYWAFSQEPAGPLRRIETGSIRIDFPWVADEVHHLRFITATGATFEHTIEVALKTPILSWPLLVKYGGIGILVGFIPVVFGMLFFPAIKSVGAEGLEFVLAMTIGLLGYLFIDMTLEGLELSEKTSAIFGGGILVLIPMIVTATVLEAISQGSRQQREGIELAILIALGIGLHNFGEGLAIGASLSANKIALSAFLIIGFTLHNTTEGVGIVSPLARQRVSIKQFAGLAMLAGLPAVPGVWIGVFSFSPHWAAVFFGIGAGAIVQVVISIDRYVSTRRNAHDNRSRFNRTSMAGYCSGIAIMYGTALLISI